MSNPIGLLALETAVPEHVLEQADVARAAHDLFSVATRISRASPASSRPPGFEPDNPRSPSRGSRSHMAGPTATAPISMGRSVSSFARPDGRSLQRRSGRGTSKPWSRSPRPASPPPVSRRAPSAISAFVQTSGAYPCSALAARGGGRPGHRLKPRGRAPRPACPARRGRTLHAGVPPRQADQGERRGHRVVRRRRGRLHLRADHRRRSRAPPVSP